MRPLRAWFLRLAGLLRTNQRDRELAEEIETHLQLHIEDNLRWGMTPEQARRDAVIKLGGIEPTKENYRDRRGLPVLETLLQDLRYGLRMLRKNPGFTAVAIVTLALGIGANTAMFSIVNGFLRPLSVRDPQQITALSAQAKADSLGNDHFFSYPAFLDFQKQANVFSDLFAYRTDLAGLSAGGRADQVLVSYVTGNYFSALGVDPARGRLFLPGEGENPSPAPILVLGYSFWQKRFGADPGVMGEQVLVNGRPVTIAGVVPRTFHGLNSLLEMDVYLPLSMMALEPASAGLRTDRSQREFTVLGRLKPGTTVKRAQSALNVIADRLAEQYPASDKGLSVHVFPERLARPFPDPVLAHAIPLLVSLFLVLAGLVLLLACMNVANILLVRATVRQREMAIRVALGAGCRRLVHQMLTESLLLAFLGGIAGVILGKWGSALSSSIDLETNLPVRLDFTFDWRVFTYGLAAAVFTGLVVGVWPAFRASRANMRDVLHEGGRTDSAGVAGSRMRSALVVAQVAGSLMILIIAGLFIGSLTHAEHMYLGFDPDHLLVANLDPHLIGYEQSRTREFYRELEARIRALPGVHSVSQAYSMPMGNYGDGDRIYVEGRPLAPGQQLPQVMFNRIDANYFETMQVPLLGGRAFTDSDSEKAPLVAIVNQTMVQQFWPNQDPIGKHFRMSSLTGPRLQVVGVAGDGKYIFIAEDALPYFYVPLEQNFNPIRVFQIRCSASPQSLLAPIQREIHELDPGMPIRDLRTMQQSLLGLNGFFVFRLGAFLAGPLGILGLTLAVVGVYGVLSFAASQRTREIGIRMALGADPRDVLRLVLRQGFIIVGIGLIIGLAAALAAARFVGDFLVVSPTDAATYFAVSFVLALVALAACCIPALRASRLDPMIALRYE